MCITWAYLLGKSARWSAMPSMQNSRIVAGKLLLSSTKNTPRRHPSRLVLLACPGKAYLLIYHSDYMLLGQLFRRHRTDIVANLEAFLIVPVLRQCYPIPFQLDLLHPSFRLSVVTSTLWMLSKDALVDICQEESIPSQGFSSFQDVLSWYGTMESKQNRARTLHPKCSSVVGHSLDFLDHEKAANLFSQYY